MGTFGQRLRDLRNSRGISQNELSKHIGVSKSSVNMYERDEREPGFETLEAIADFFNVNMDYLLGRESRISADATPLELFINAQVPDSLFTASAKPLLVKFINTLNAAIYSNTALKSPGFLENFAKIREEMERTFMPSDFENFTNILKAINAVLEQAMKQVMEPDSEGSPIPPPVGGPQVAPSPQEGNDTTPVPDAPETPPEGE